MNSDVSRWKVFCIASDCSIQGSHYAKVWQQHFEGGLKKAVAQTVFPSGIDWLTARQNPHCPKEWTEGGRAEISSRLLGQIKGCLKQGGLDCVISYLYSSDVDPGVVREITRAGIPWVNFFCDSVHVFPLVSEISREVSLAWFPESAAIPKYKEVGARILCAPYAVDCGEKPLVPSRKPRWDVVFAGGPDSRRPQWLGLLVKLGYRVRICGMGWKETETEKRGPPGKSRAREKRWLRAVREPRRVVEAGVRRWLSPAASSVAEGYCREEEWESFLQDAAVNLGLNAVRVGNSYVSYPKLRDFEMPGYGVCYLTQRNADLSAVWEEGEEIEMFGGVAEFLWKMRRLCRDPERRMRLGARGAKAVRERHCWKTRLQQIRESL